VISMLGMTMVHPVAMAAKYNDNSIAVLTGASFLTSGVKTVSDNIEINEIDRLSGFEYSRHFNSETAVTLSYVNFGTVTLNGPADEQFFTQDNQRVDLGEDAEFKVSTRGVALAGQFRSWFSNSWAAQISLGIQHWRRQVEYRNLDNNPQWPAFNSGHSAIWSLGLVAALSNWQMSFALGSAHFGDSGIMHSQQASLAVAYGF